MKVLHLSALDGSTGAGIAAARIHVGLRERGVDSRFCVAFPSVGLPDAFTPRVTLAGRIGRLARQAASGRIVRHAAPGYDYVLSTGLVGFDIRRIVAQECPDIVQLHWIGGQSYRLPTLAGLKIPVVWRLSDMWAFCGLEHLQPDPSRYTNPPRQPIGLSVWSDFSERLRARKMAIYQSLPRLYFTSPSRWLLGEAKCSALLRDSHLELIATGCDTTLFSPKSRKACREALDLPSDKSIVLIGATSMGTHWKGMDLFVTAMKTIAATDAAGAIHVVTFGMDQQGAAELEGLMSLQHLGPVRDRRLMAALYSAADVLVAPSRMENLANTVLESLSCGTPVVAFSIGGMPDMIEHKVNGFLAAPYDAGEIAAGIRWAVGVADYEQVRQAARQKIVKEFSAPAEIERYVALYERILASPQ